ncbi:MAG: ComF family protein [Coprococcus sp.]
MIKEIFINLFYPRRCPLCDRVMGQDEGMLCEAHKVLPYVRYPGCLKCGKELEDDSQEYCQDCRLHPRHFIRGFPVFNYREPVKSSVLAIKYHNKREYCDFYADEMAKKILPYMTQIKPDVIIPVPMYKRKQKERGFNQAELLAVKLGAKLKLPVYTDVLTRERMTTPQKTLDNLERANNIKNAIRIKPLPNNIKNVLIVDDIYTTGATMETCTLKLLEAGAENIYFTTVCIGKGR